MILNFNYSLFQLILFGFWVNTTLLRLATSVEFLYLCLNLLSFSEQESGQEAEVVEIIWLPALLPIYLN
jgi:hypothetical protein